MGKRSNFERIERDFYPTPFEAVEPLIPHLPDKFTFAEPCAGNGILIEYLQKNGFKVYPVNPSMKGEKILGEKVFGNISEIDNPVEIVDVFRPSNEVVTIAEETVKINAKVLWLQLDISNEEAKKIVETNDIIYIDNKCTKIEYEKYFN